MHIGQETCSVSFQKTPQEVVQGSWHGPRLPEQCRGTSLEGAARLKKKCCSDLQNHPQHLGFTSLLEPLHPQDMRQLRWFLS